MYMYIHVIRSSIYITAVLPQIIHVAIDSTMHIHMLPQNVVVMIQRLSEIAFVT